MSAEHLSVAPLSAAHRSAEARPATQSAAAAAALEGGAAHKKEVALSVSRSILKGDWERLEQLLAPGFTYTGDSAVYSRDQYFGFMQALKQAMAGMTMEFTHVLCEGDLVSIRFVTRAKNVGKFMGAPSTGKDVVITGIFVRQVEGDRVVQEWQTTDLLGLMTQMGFTTLLGYTVAAGLFKKTAPPPPRQIA